MGLDRILVSGAPAELVNIASQAKGSDFNAQTNRLLELVGDDSSKILGIITYIDVEDNSSSAAAAASEVDSSIDIKDRLKLAAKLLYRLNPKDLNERGLQDAVKRVETAVRNQGLLNHEDSPDLTFKTPSDELEGFVFVGEQPEAGDFHAHKGILALESDYFKAMSTNWGIQNNELTPESELMKQVLDYLYMSDDKRKEFIRNIDKAHLPEVFDLANRWLLTDLINDCGLQICNNLNLYDINGSNIDDWIELSSQSKSLNALLKFIKRAAKLENQTVLSKLSSILRTPTMSNLSSMLSAPEDRISLIVEKINDSSGFNEIVKKCTPEEIEIFRTLNTPFGQFLNYAFNAAKEWRDNFGIEIDVSDMPPIPQEILMAMERKDDWQSYKSIGNSSTLFYLPKEIGTLGQFSKILSDRNVGRLYTHNHFAGQYWEINESRWVLIRNENIPVRWFQGIRREEDQRILMESKLCRLPTLSEAIVFSFMTLAREGKFPYEQLPSTRTIGDFAQGTVCNEIFEYSTTEFFCISPNSSERTLKITSESEPDPREFGKACVWNDLKK